MSHSSKNIALSEYLKDVEQKSILISLFQRDFVWTKSKMVKLAASLLKGYPIGSFLLMQDAGIYSKKPVEGIVEDINNEYNSENMNALLILDGQQRITSIYQIFYGKGKYNFYVNFEQFVQDIYSVNDDKIVGVIEDNIEDWLIAVNKNDKSDKNPGNNPDTQRSKGLFPLDIIFNGGAQGYSVWLDRYCMSKSLVSNNQIDTEEYNKLSKCKEIFIKRMIENLTSYKASEIVIDKNTSPNIVCSIFETINSTGQSLTVIDLLNAKCYAYGFMLRSELDEALSQNEFMREFDDGKDSIGLAIVRTIGLLCKKSCKKSDLLNLKADEIKGKWNIAVEYIADALKYIRENYGVIGISYFPYKDMTSVIAIIKNSDKYKANPNNKYKLDKWYWNAVFSGYYDNATESKNSKALKEFFGTDVEKGWFDDDKRVPEIVRNQAYLEDLYNGLDSLSAVRSAQYKAILNLYVLNGAKDFSIEKQCIYNMKERDVHDHHIFPKKFLSLHSIKKDEANTILNRTLISDKVNEKIKETQPITYLTDVNIVGKNKFSKEDLDTHYIDDIIIKEEFSSQLYSKFKENRKVRIIETIKEKVTIDK